MRALLSLRRSRLLSRVSVSAVRPTAAASVPLVSLFLLQSLSNSQSHSHSNPNGNSIPSSSAVSILHRSYSSPSSSSSSLSYYSPFHPPSLPVDPPIVVSKGLASRPLSFSELSHWIATHHFHHLGGRSPEEREKYRLHRLHIANEWNSLDEFIRVKYLSIPHQLDPVTGKKCATPIGTIKELEQLIYRNGGKICEIPSQVDRSVANEKDPDRPIYNDLNVDMKPLPFYQLHRYDEHFIVLTPNEFPYWTESPIQHYLIWSFSPTITNSQLEHCMNYYFPLNCYDRIGFVNPPSLRSVKSVYHAHIFVKPRY